MALTDDLADGVFDPKPGGITAPIFGTGTPTYVLGPDTSNMFKDLYVDSSNRPGALIASWIKGEITFEELKAAIPNEEFRNSLLGQFGYNPEGNKLAPVEVGKPVYVAEEEPKTEPEPEESGEEPTKEAEGGPTEQEITDAIINENWKDFIDYFPSPEEAGQWIKDRWQDLKNVIGKVVQVTTPPDDYKECEINNGGYNSRQECIAAKTRVQIVPEGLPPIPLPGIKIEDLPEAGANVLGTIQDILDSAGDAASGVWDWITGALEDGTIDVGTVINSVLMGDYTFGGLFEGDSGAEETPKTPQTPVTGAEDGGGETSIFTDTTETESTDRLGFGYETPLTAEGEITEVVTGGVEDTSDNGSPLVFGYEFPSTSTSDTAEIGSSPITGAVPEETLISGASGGAGGGAGGGEGAFDPLIKTIPFNPPAVPGMLRTPFIDSVAELNKIIARNSNRGGMLV